MTKATVSVLDSKALLALFGTHDQHLRRIRDTLGVTVVARENQIVIEGEKSAVSKATSVLERLSTVAKEYGVVYPEDVDACLVDSDSPAVTPSVVQVPRVGEPGTRKAVRPRTSGQRRYWEAIAENEMVFCVGPAGTGKTYLAVAAAVDALMHGDLRRIVLVRPAVEAGESLGFLPGDMAAKINPYLRPLLDALRDMMDPELVRRYTEQEVIEVIPLAYMRGRTLNDAFIILDEAQNTTVSQMKMFLTRMGHGSKVVVSGDSTQVDLPDRQKSGLTDAIERLHGIEGLDVVRLTKADIVRHRLVQEIVQRYEAAQGKRGQAEMNS